MHAAADALAWAESLLGADVMEVVELAGGLTSTMLMIADDSGRRCVLRLMVREPWRSHGAELVRREQAALRELALAPVPAPVTVALDADGVAAGVAAHLMSHVPGSPAREMDGARIEAMADMLCTIHAVQPAEPFRAYESWAWEAKREVPAWSMHPASWRTAFDVLLGDPPAFRPTFLQRDYSHRNLLWAGRTITGVVDWVEASTGPVWLDAAHAATTLALAFGPEPARAFLAAYAERTAEPCRRHWLVMDAVGFLPAPGSRPLFGSPTELRRLDAWVHDLVTRDEPG